MGWAYVVTRVLYIPLVFMGGIGTSGPKNLILLSTVPGYVCLMALATQLLRAV